MSIVPAIGRPGIGAVKRTGHKIVSQDGHYDFLPGGGIIDGAKSRDPDNDVPTVLRAGLLMGKVAASGKYANSVIGVTQGALATNGTSVTLTPAQAAELVRRIGSTGTFTLTGPPTAAGTVASQTVTYTAVNAGTGVVTINTTGVAFVAGSLVGDTDGSQAPKTVVPDGWGLNVAASTGADVDFPQIPITGILRTDAASGVINYPADASLKAWVRSSLNVVGGGRFAFTDVL